MHLLLPCTSSAGPIRFVVVKRWHLALKRGNVGAHLITLILERTCVEIVELGILSRMGNSVWCRKAVDVKPEEWQVKARVLDGRNKVTFIYSKTVVIQLANIRRIA